MKRSFLLLSIAFLSMYAMATDLFMSSNQKIISETISKAFFVIETPFNIQDSTGVIYGRNHTFFSRTYTLGIPVKEGFLLQSEALYPWVGDKDFERYQKSYKPVLRPSCIHKIGVDEQDSLLLDTTALAVQPLGNDLMYVTSDSLGEVKGLKMDTALSANGWLVLIVSTEEISKINSSTTSRFIVYRKTCDFADTDTCTVEDVYLDENENIWGGLWLIPHSDGIGTFTLSLGGLCSYNGGEWIIRHVSIDEITRESAPEPEEELIEEPTIPEELTVTEETESPTETKKVKTRKTRH